MMAVAAVTAVSALNFQYFMKVPPRADHQGVAAGDDSTRRVPHGLRGFIQRRPFSPSPGVFLPFAIPAPQLRGAEPNRDGVLDLRRRDG